MSWSPRAVFQYRRILASERLNPQRPCRNPRQCDEWPIYSRYTQLGEIAEMPRRECEALIMRMAVQYWLEAESYLFRTAQLEEYLLLLRVDEWAADEFPQPYVLFCGSSPRDVYDINSFVPATSRLSRLIFSYLEEFEIGFAARIFETDQNWWQGGTRVFVDFDLPCHPSKLRIG